MSEPTEAERVSELQRQAAEDYAKAPNVRPPPATSSRTPALTATSREAADAGHLRR